MSFEYECDKSLHKPWSWVLKRKGVVLAQSPGRFSTRRQAVSAARRVAEESWTAFFKASK